MIVTAGLPGCSHGRQELNPQPTALETAALPVELRPYEVMEIRETPPDPDAGWAAFALRGSR